MYNLHDDMMYTMISLVSHITSVHLMVTFSCKVSNSKWKGRGMASIRAETIPSKSEFHSSHTSFCDQGPGRRICD